MNSHYLNSISLAMVTDFVSNFEGAGDPVSLIIKKVNQMTMAENCSLNDKILKKAIDLINYNEEVGISGKKDKNGYTYQDLINQMYCWSTFHLSPYQMAPDSCNSFLI